MMLVGGVGSKAFSQPDHLFRIYEDNDFINIAGKGTDKGYTNGTRFDYFYLKKTPSHFFLDKWFPTAGAGAVDTYSYSLMQVMLGPKDISKPEPDKNDWPYAAALVASHGMYSTHPGRELAIQTEITAGVIGPLALGRQFQTWAHSIIGYTKPRGWDKQMPNDVLLNINLQAWKMIWQPGSAFELMGGGQVQAGTMLDGVSLHLLLRAGNMRPFFSSYIDQFASARGKGRRLQYYFFIKPAVQWWSYNALIQGGIFSGKSSYYAGIDSKGQSPSLRKITGTVDAGLVLVAGNVSLSFIQKELSPLIHDVSDQTVGNISLTISW
ncbi:MAG TPA: lipid A deacylase LpxR family protein [Puia sp.]|jgi:hypothetical protein|nr:lipid A deacylase LpxR family protein [Puia sp.]